MANDKTGNVVVRFVREVRDEAYHVTWPSKKQTTRLTLIVVGVSLAMAVYLGGLDFAFTKLMGLII